MRGALPLHLVLLIMSSPLSMAVAAGDGLDAYRHPMEQGDGDRQAGIYT